MDGQLIGTIASLWDHLHSPLDVAFTSVFANPFGFVSRNKITLDKREVHLAMIEVQ